ncbi:amino acid adenylation domain-containing protein [Allokutzneria albata]|uniref:Amino acid adenylation domain-containing protein n=1 Tax=Allokutzneria albata TaxID=211114 RepID=A0A1G9U0P0_ALLAB|nr:amino acid adenylation domain-containing protein [Allokutzneria albata]SDM53095.1 amino acid adenylation domain-containing protein [Allokutzneria albata]
MTTVVDLLERRVLAHPEVEAVRFRGEAISYAELWERAGHVAEKVLASGGGPGRPVGLHIERSIELVVSFIGILRSGSACVALDTAYPEDRLRYMCEDAQCALVVGDFPYLSTMDGQVDEDTCYIAYTSGSTGRPKGVVYGHAGVTSFVEWQVADSVCGVGDRTLQLTPISFDVAYEEILATLCSGGTLVCCEEDERLDPDLLWDLIEREGVHRVFLTFVGLKSLAVFAQDRDISTYPLREVVVGGERLRCDDDVRRMFAELPRCDLINQWGTVEVLIATNHRLTGDPAAWPLHPPVGMPLPHIHVHVRDSDGAILPPGERGELVVAGDCVARGYHGLPERTAASFVPDPCTLDGRAYLTGDLGLITERGEVECLGRMDDQVKIRGHRVEPSEVEHVINDVPGVAESAVYVAGESSLDRHLAAVVVPRTPALSAAEVFARLRDRMPDYMVPSRIDVVSALPRTPSGKLDRRAFGGWSA